jgi:LEA14-like dessication related protein
MKMKVALLAVLLTVLSGCAGFGGRQDPIRVTVSSIHVLESTMLEQLYLVTLRVQNHDVDTLEIEGGSFDLQINGRDFGSGVSQTSVSIPPYADDVIEVRMVSTLFGMLRVIQSLQSGGGEKLDYELSGRVSARGYPLGIRFHEYGDLGLPLAPVN